MKHADLNKEVNERIEKQNFSNIFVSEVGSFDQNITKGGEGEEVMIFSDLGSLIF